jgi:hypothetical protein
MNRFISPLLHLCTAALLAVVVLVQGYLLEHRTEHLLSGESESCLVCQLGGHLGDALIATPLPLAATPQTMERVTRHYTFAPRYTHHFSARAPPLPLAL